MPEAKQFGRPRKTPAGGQTVTFYLPKDVVSWIKEKGGARWYASKRTNYDNE